MREAIQEFRDAVHRAGERGQPPALQAILEREQPAPVLQWRWAAAVMVAVMLGAIPVYRDAQRRQQEAERQRADVLLLEQVDSALARSAPRAFSALMGN